jgi:hypothetical protein
LKDTEFVVISAENKLIDFKGDGKPENKVAMTIELNGQQMEYLPNRTSVETMCKAKGSYVVSELVGFNGLLFTQDTNFGKAIYVKTND